MHDPSRAVRKAADELFAKVAHLEAELSKAMSELVTEIKAAHADLQKLDAKLAPLEARLDAQARAPNFTFH